MKSLEEIIKDKFSHLSNEALIKRINKRFKADLNDDDEVYELARRKKEQGFDVKATYDTYYIVYKN